MIEKVNRKWYTKMLLKHPDLNTVIGKVSRKWYTKMLLKHPELSEVLDSILKLAQLYQTDKVSWQLKDKDLYFRRVKDIISDQLISASINRKIYDPLVTSSVDFATNDTIFGIGYFRSQQKFENIIAIQFIF